MAASKNDPDAVSIEDHLALQAKVEKLEALLATKPPAPAGTPEAPLHMRVLPEPPDDPAKFDPSEHGYEGSFIERSTQRKYARKVVAGAAKPHKLFTTDHGQADYPSEPRYHELTEAEFRNLFDKE